MKPVYSYSKPFDNEFNPEQYDVYRCTTKLNFSCNCYVFCIKPDAFFVIYSDGSFSAKTENVSYDLEFIKLNFTNFTPIKSITFEA